MKVVNLTPHKIVMNDGTEYAPSGEIARVSAGYSEFNERGICTATFGSVSGLPDPADDTLYVVSGMVASAVKRADVVAPATGHPECVRNEKGHIVSVPGFVSA